jgi:hypothetical protein
MLIDLPPRFEAAAHARDVFESVFQHSILALSISDPFDRTDHVEEGRFSESERALECGRKLGRPLDSLRLDTVRGGEGA